MIGNGGGVSANGCRGAMVNNVDRDGGWMVFYWIDFFYRIISSVIKNLILLI